MFSLQRKFTDTLPAFTHRNYTIFWLGSLLSNIGTWMQESAQPWLVLSLSLSPFLLGVDAFAAHIPAILFLPWAGVLADRYDRKRLIFLGTLICMFSAIILTVLLATHKVKVPHIILLSFLTGAATAISGPAFQSFLPSLVRREHLANAIAMTSVQFNISRVVGPVLAGLALTNFGPIVCFGLNAFSFVALLIAILFVRILAPEKGATRPIIDSEVNFSSGLRIIKTLPRIMGLLCVLSVSSFFVGPLIPFLAVLIKNVYHQDAKAYSVALTMFGMGAVSAALFLASSKKLPKLPWIIELSSLTSAIMMLWLSLTPSFAWTKVILVISGFSFILCYAMANTLIQTSIPDGYRGRVMSFFVITFRGFVPLGTLATGFLVGILGIKATFAYGALLHVICLGIIHKFYFADATEEEGTTHQSLEQRMQKRQSSI